jgi:hypothetical protein
MIALAAAVCAAGCASFKNWPYDVAQGVVSRWAKPSASLGRQMIAEYGVPDDVTPERLTWNDKGHWKRTVVWNQKPVYRSLSDLAVMEQTVDYRLLPAQIADLLAFSDLLTIDARRGELSSRSDRESTNFLNINLADEVARGLKTPQQAAVDARTILELASAGKSSPYTTTLLLRSVDGPIK